MIGGYQRQSETSAKLLSDFIRRWHVNQTGGLRARLARWKILHWLLLQRAGIHRWVKAPLFSGDRMWMLTGETTSRGLLAFGYSESALTALMLKVVKPGMRFIDVGAHLGYEAMLASVLVGEEGRVVSFEPQSQIASWTLRNLQGFQQTRIVQSAVGDFSGTLEFFELDILQSAFSGYDSTDASARKVNVPVTTLKDALRVGERPVDFIKSDVEGAEMAVLRGAKDILEQDQPFLVLEAEMPSGVGPRPRVKEFTDFLSPLGYRGISFEFDGDLKLAALGDLAEGHANVAFVPLSRPEFQSLNLR